MNSWGVIKPNSIIIPNDGDIGSAGANDAIKIDSDGNITLVGNLVVGSTKGIDFSAVSTSGSGSASALLDDYEEGSFTAIIGATSTNPNLTYSEQEGRYVKIGRQVTCWFRIQVNTAHSTGSGYLVLKTLPFTVSNDVAESGGSIGRANGWSGDHPVTMQAGAGQAYAFFSGNFENDMLNGTDDLGSGAHVTGCISYLT